MIDAVLHTGHTEIQQCVMKYHINVIYQPSCCIFIDIINFFPWLSSFQAGYVYFLWLCDSLAANPVKNCWDRLCFPTSPEEKWCWKHISAFLFLWVSYEWSARLNVLKVALILVFSDNNKNTSTTSKNETKFCSKNFSYFITFLRQSFR